jgi:hypothetical protein
MSDTEPTKTWVTGADHVRHRTDENRGALLAITTPEGEREGNYFLVD